MKRLFWVIGILLCASLAFFYTRRKKTLQKCTVQHLGIIMDGNRRWAKRQGLASWLGHRQGVNPVKTTIKFCLKNKIPYLTLYAFSLENLKRSPEELSYLFDVLAKEMAGKELDELFAHGVKIHFVGDRNAFPEQLRTIIDDAERKTAACNKLYLSILFCYGGQQEILATTRALAQQVATGTLKPDAIDFSIFNTHTWFGPIPAPDLIIRTGGAQRLSNFLTFQSAYSELYFTSLYWPEVDEDLLIDAINYFENCKRNFGT